MLLSVLLVMMSAAAATADSNRSVGCFMGSSKNRVLQHRAFKSNEMTQEKCRDACIKRSKAYFGLLAGNRCFCGNQLLTTVQLRDSFCNWKCSGNVRQACGSKNGILIFNAEEIPTAVSTTVPTTVSTTVPTTVSTTVPTTVSTAVPTTVSTTVPTTVSTTVPTKVSTTVPTKVSTTVPTTVSTAVPRAKDNRQHLSTTLTPLSHRRHIIPLFAITRNTGRDVLKEFDGPGSDELVSYDSIPDKFRSNLLDNLPHAIWKFKSTRIVMEMQKRGWVVAWAEFDVSFNISNLNSHNWLDTSRLVDSRPVRVVEESNFASFSVKGSWNAEDRRRFYIHLEHLNCENDIGVLGIGDSVDESCSWVIAGGRPPVLFYAKLSGPYAQVVGYADKFVIYLK